jgi:hypothetical protein
VPTRGPTIADATLELIREHGPQLLDELVPQLVAAGRTKAKNPKAAVLTAIGYHPALVQDLDGRWYALADQLEGAVFTVRLTDLEEREAFVLVRDDLALVGRLLRKTRWTNRHDAVHIDFLAGHLGLPSWYDGVEGVDDEGRPILQDGYLIRAQLGDDLTDGLLRFLGDLGLPEGDDEEDLLRDLLFETRLTEVLHGPPDWLPALGSRELLGLRVEGGAVRAVALDKREVSGVHVDAAANRIRRLWEDIIAEDDPWDLDLVIPLDELLGIIATDAPELFRRPLPPIHEVLERCGLDVEDGLVGQVDDDGPAVGRNWSRSGGRNASGLSSVLEEQEQYRLH